MLTNRTLNTESLPPGTPQLLNLEDLSTNLLRTSCNIMKETSKTASEILAKIFTKILLRLANF